MSTTRRQCPAFPIKGARARNDRTRAKRHGHKMPLRQNGVIQKAQRDEACQEFGFQAPFAAHGLAVKSGDAVRILGIVQPQKLTRQDLPFRPNSARNFGVHIRLEGLGNNPTCHRIGILIAPAQQPRPFICPAKIKRAEGNLAYLRLSGQSHPHLT